MRGLKVEQCHQIMTKIEQLSSTHNQIKINREFMCQFCLAEALQNVLISILLFLVLTQR